MIKVWILTVLLTTNSYSDSTISEKYTFKTKDECIAASKFYGKLKFSKSGYRDVS